MIAAFLKRNDGAIATVLAAAFAGMIGFSLADCTAAQIKADVPIAENLFAGLCKDETMIPYVGAYVASMCPAQVALFNSEMNKIGAPTPGPRPVAVFAKTSTGLLVHCGTLAAVTVDAGAPKADGGK